jgi:pimeloyl-ACP methyl ester carboxylesterase
LRNDVKLHYVLSKPKEFVSGKTALVVFIHGFPDSWHLWKSFLTNKKLQDNAVLVAVDLPGYGGSESLKRFDAQGMLEAMSDFILSIREEHLPTSEGESKVKSPVIVIGHDWGAVIGFRLAAEAPGIADRFILSNGVHPDLAKANAGGKIASATRMLKLWAHAPTNMSPLRQAFSSARPILIQLLKSGYIFTYNLPRPFVFLLGGIGDHWLIRLLNGFAAGPNPAAPLPGIRGLEVLASSLGPSKVEFSFDPSKQKLANGDSSEQFEYPASIYRRTTSGGFMEKVRIYREGLIWKRWEKSLETLWELSQLDQARESSGSSTGSGRRRSSSKVGLFDLGPPGSFRAPITVVWGQDDVAIESCLALDSMPDYFGMHGSHLVKLADVGHWVPLDEKGAEAWIDIVDWSVRGEVGSLKERLQRFSYAAVAVES